MSNRYELREQIGKGGLGAVYKALDTQLQREVAVKRVLTAERATEEEVKEAAEKLMAEAQTLSSLNHPNIITVFDVGQDEKGGFVVMELLKGETLDETIERGVLTQEDFTEIVYQTMEALIAAQANNVIHRDIKPTNIMVIWQASGKFQTKILDFGLAKFSKSPSVQTMDQDESVMGSIFFMAPEQFERGELDSRTDIYQMGCVYYNALTGQYPFNGETAPQVMNAHLQHKVVPLEQVRPDLSPSICQWVMWLINRDIEHRPKDAREALKHWPRDPEPPGAVPVEALPVEETPEVSTGEIKIVRASSGASAPPALIVTGTAPNLPRGGRTGRIHGGRTGPLTGSIRPGRPNVKRTSSSSGGGGKLKWIIIGSVVSAIAIFVALQVVSSANQKKAEQRIVTLAAQDNPVATAADVTTALDVLENDSSSAALKGDAKKILERIELPAANDMILNRLSSTGSSQAKLAFSEILSERNYNAAIPAIMAAFQSASSDDEQTRLLDAVRGVAEMKDIETILDGLKGDPSLNVRRVFEDTVLSILRKSEDTGRVIDEILSRVSTTSGSERKSLFRILGVMGGEKVRTRLTAIYNKENDPEYQRDAMIAYLSWRDRSVLDDVETIVNETEDKALRSGGEKAYARLATLPGPEPIAEKVEAWKTAFELITNPNDVRRLIGAMIEYPSPQTLNLLRQWQNHPNYGAIAKSAVTTLQRSMAGLPVLKPGDELKGNKARVQGNNRGASINSFLSSLTNWTSPETWFSWSFKVEQPGEYSVEIDQAYMREKPSEFIVYLGEFALLGQTEKTKSLEEFTAVKLPGTITLAPNQVYTLVLTAGEKVQPRMMDIGAVRLVKQ